jgi:predicted membrane protein
MNTPDQHPNDNYNPHKGRIWAGIIVLFVGIIFLLRESNFFFFPRWLFSWPMILIAVGLYSGAKHNFRNPFWIIPFALGCIFLLDEFDFGFNLHRFIAPIIIIAVGMMMILRPKYPRGGTWHNDGTRSSYRRDRTTAPFNYPPSAPLPLDPVVKPLDPSDTFQANASPEDYIDVTSVMGNARRIITSKQFKGGTITCFMGGAEIDLTNADINGTVLIDLTTVMGGAKLIVPANWEVKPEITNVLGGMEDKRQLQGKVIDFNKILVLRGQCVMGGVELRSY